MFRCDKPTGRFSVTAQFINNDGSDDDTERFIYVGPHAVRTFRCVDGVRKGELFEGEMPPHDGAWQMVEEKPIAGVHTPYEGELCTCELAWLRSLPGKLFNAHYRFAVKEAT